MDNIEYLDLQTKDREIVWHSMRAYQSNFSEVFVKGEGCHVINANGTKYLDAMSGLWSVNVGYGRTELAEAAYKQLNQLAFYPLTQSHLPAIKLAEKLNSYLDNEYVFFFSNSGSEANELAFKIARQYQMQKGQHSKSKIVSRYRSYHGNTLGALAATGQAQRKYKYEPLVQGFIHVSPPDMYRNDYCETDNPLDLECVKVVDEVMTWELSETIAAFIMEPIITGGGILMPPDDYMKGIKSICEKHDALLIVDEVICGFGRTGEMFGFMNYGVKPDIISMAKGITSSYLPLAATAVKKEVFDQFKGAEMYDHLRHVNTSGGHPASCAVAIENIEILERENLVMRSKEKGERLLKELQELLSAHPNVGEVRGKGLLIGIELVESKKTKEPIHPVKINRVVASCKEKGVIIGKNGDTVAGFNNVLQIAPPLSIQNEELEQIVKTVVESIVECL